MPFDNLFSEGGQMPECETFSVFVGTTLVTAYAFTSVGFQRLLKHTPLPGPYCNSPASP